MSMKMAVYALFLLLAACVLLEGARNAEAITATSNYLLRNVYNITGAVRIDTVTLNLSGVSRTTWPSGSGDNGSISIFINVTGANFWDSLNTPPGIWYAGNTSAEIQAAEKSGNSSAQMIAATNSSVQWNASKVSAYVVCLKMDCTANISHNGTHTLVWG